MVSIAHTESFYFAKSGKQNAKSFLNETITPANFADLKKICRYIIDNTTMSIDLVFLNYPGNIQMSA